MTLSQKERDILNNLLLEAVGNGDLARMKTYVQKGADINVQNMTRETVRNNGTYTSNGRAPLYHYMYENQWRRDVSDYMLSQGVDVDVKNFNGNTPLMLAVRNLDLDRVRYLLSKGADPMASNNRGEIVLEMARLNDSSYTYRQNIIDALVDALENPVEKAPPPPPAETAREIQVLKPLALAPRKPGGGFNL